MQQLQEESCEFTFKLVKGCTIIAIGRDAISTHKYSIRRLKLVSHGETSREANVNIQKLFTVRSKSQEISKGISSGITRDLRKKSQLTKKTRTIGDLVNTAIATRVLRGSKVVAHLVITRAPFFLIPGKFCTAALGT